MNKPPPMDLGLTSRVGADPCIWNLLETAKFKLKPYLEAQKVKELHRKILRETYPSKQRETFNSSVAYDEALNKAIEKLQKKKKLDEAVGSEHFERLPPSFLTSDFQIKRRISEEKAFDKLGDQKQKFRAMKLDPFEMLMNRAWLKKYEELDDWMIDEVLYGSEYFKFYDYAYFMYRYS
ncbi:hypothetical protein PsorP6_017177 [Peronosclerospora sorghi]|uniref:Uncharacterized protein n=1 Tax=Peronosclerospora sorghi TaxID=230839 RepID=A0ACC0WFA8_9STRA|nr:hypothetical protein PsorP6_017177 [Peronosclerospora sorghi]